MFEPGNTHHTKRKRCGRRRKLARTLSELVGVEKLEQFALKMFAEAIKGDAVARAWVLSQLPRKSEGVMLPPGLPPLTTFENYIVALNEIGEAARLGTMTADDAERASNLIAALTSSRSSIVNKLAAEADREVTRQIEHERRQVPVASSPVIINGHAREVF